MYSLDGKVALVTGGTTGIGRESAITLAKAGANVVVTGRREKEGEETVQLIEGAGGVGHFIQMDVKNEDAIKNGLAQLFEQYGRLDIALNNAGVESLGPVTEVEKDTYDHVFDINVWGVLASMKHEIPLMLKSGGGSIINMSSVAGHIGMPHLSVYIASKHAVEGLTKSTALEYATEKIRVNAIAPAVIETPMADRFMETMGPGSDERFAAMHPVGRTGQPREIADVVLFLASEASSFITGESIRVDGGYVAQ